MLTIKLSKRADKALGKIPAKQAKQIAARIKKLADDPETLPTVELKGYAPWRRAKSGEYRIIYKIDVDILRVALVGKRNDDEIYRLIERFLR
nr:type II toxin-antitoxin system RelE/ParE family toxin [uncultured Paraglaciecola sp.]